MAEAMLGIIAKKAGEIAVSQIIKESSRFSCVREDLLWIETEMRRIQSYLEDAEAKQFKTKGVSNFIREIQDLAYDVEDIIDTYFAKISLMSRTRWKRLLDFRNMRIAHRFVKEVEGIRKRVEDIKNSRQTFGIDECSRSCEEDTWDPRQSFPHFDEPNVVGFDDLIKILVHKVLDEDSHHRVVSIVGFPGLGKTTLARKVYNSAWQSKVYNSRRRHFDCAAWICVSESPNEKGLLRDIAGQVGLEKEKMEHNLETHLYEFLSRKRYVIVIDDIWHTRAWDALKIGLPMNSENGSRIVLTSRHTNVGVHVGGPNSVLLLEPLDQETSRRLFYKLIVDDLQNICQRQDPPQLEKIGEQILEKCGGVPLAIVLAADEINCNTALKLRRVAIHGSDTDHYPALYPKTSSLRAMFCFDPRYPCNSKAHKNLLGASKFLRVLSVEEGNDVPRSLLTKISNLRQLTYLKLGSSGGVTLELPSAVSNLKSLLTLDLREAFVVCLPNVIWSMKQLRHILLPDYCYAPPFCRVNLDVFHPVEISLPNLQTLHGLPVYLFKADWLHKITSLRTFRVADVNEDIIGVLSDAAPVSHKLEKLSLVGHLEFWLETASLNLVRYDNLFELYIRGVKLNDLSHDKLPPNLTKLTLGWTRLTTNPTEALQKLHKLKFLELYASSFLGKELVFSGEPGYFPQLEVLEIGHLPNLERVVVEEGGLPRLRDFMICGCSSETLLPDRVRNAMRTK
ncbi:hypothetical protein RHSIM_Rhsim05G0157000 [Rhododendron simsii]|uniref:Uncharacterized protein n=1 Tax=Rhododendron simsii TaxID=118357 RepID=A0A834H782_RHOSS|nr:hypothetical protein RHSIM_Rhsim05G0157000 [Rhododendron simsii]